MPRAGGQPWWGLVRAPYLLATDDYRMRLRALPYRGRTAGARAGMGEGALLSSLGARAHLRQVTQGGATVYEVIARG
jgi:hypothetical protein